MNTNRHSTAPQIIHARSCTIELISHAEAQKFVEKSHRAGASGYRGKVISLGIKDKVGVLVGVAQFCLPRTKAKQRLYTTELLRLAFPHNVTVVGGASKLISHYRKTYHPADIFTYQDGTGALSNVYLHCGFSFAGQAKKKTYLVAPGQTLATAKRGEYYSIAEVVRRGPDALLSENLGEIFTEGGKRLTNVELFTSVLGWSEESVSGDKVWEWFNPDLTFYTYKITASDSPKSYIGVSHVKLNQAAKKDCLNDGYWGSGGLKFQNWKKRHLTKLHKEVIETFPSKALAFEAERKLLAKAIHDDNCLNIRPGGLDYKFAKSMGVAQGECQVHGEAPFLGKFCIPCKNQNLVSIKKCVIHGEVKHLKNTCYICMNQKSVKLRSCEFHGQAKHQGDTCIKCANTSRYTLKICEIHGEVKFFNERCAKCIQLKKARTSDCKIHGESTHYGDQCLKCSRAKTVKVKKCTVHGPTKFSGKTCFKCYLKEQRSVSFCDVHGLVAHHSQKCLRCVSVKSVHLAECTVHGVTKFKGKTCSKCLVQAAITVENCDEHGMVKHRSGKCYKCRNGWSTQACEVHGVVKHRSGKCLECVKKPF